MSALNRILVAGRQQFLNVRLVQHSSVAVNPYQGRRYLFSSEVLGIEGFHRQKSAMVSRVADKRGKFFEQLRGSLERSADSQVFTDDLKAAIYLADTDDEINTVISMIERFHSQSCEVRFTNFVFGPLVMRLFHVHRKPEMAFELFTTEELSSFFDQLSTYVILMDLMFESRFYREVIQIQQTITNKQLAGFKYPIDCVTLTMAACLKLNTSESYKTMTELISQTQSVAAPLSTRAVVYGALLCLKQGEGQTAANLLSLQSSATAAAYLNVKLLTFIRLRRYDDAISLLKDILKTDSPSGLSTQIFHEILQELRQELVKFSRKQLVVELDTIEKNLGATNYINMSSFDSYLFRPILRQRKLQDGYKQRRQQRRT